MIKAYDFLCMGGDMGIAKLERCPKCRGHLIIEEDNYGLYQQCLQCGYLHDLQTFPTIASEEEERESIVTSHISAKSLHDILCNATRLLGDYHRTDLADPIALRLILDALRKQQEGSANKGGSTL
jgi:DNA-directed RNA polymerase subunit M/transcription elongation factor TFIIS